MDSKFDERINQLYSEMVQDSVMKQHTENEADTEGEEKVSVSDNELANARRYVNRKKILGVNVGQSRQVKKELQRKKDLDQEYEDAVMPDVLDRLQRSNDATQDEIDSMR